MKTDERTSWLHSNETLLEQKINLDEELILMRRFYGFQNKQYENYEFFKNSDTDDPITNKSYRHPAIIDLNYQACKRNTLSDVLSVTKNDAITFAALQLLIDQIVIKSVSKFDTDLLWVGCQNL